MYLGYPTIKWEYMKRIEKFFKILIPKSWVNIESNTSYLEQIYCADSRITAIECLSLDFPRADPETMIQVQVICLVV